jgi:hypothetical protein
MLSVVCVDNYSEMLEKIRFRQSQPHGKNRSASIPGPKTVTARWPSGVKEDATDDPPVIDSRHTVRPREMPLDPAHLRIRQPNQITHCSASSRRNESTDRHIRNRFNRS